jgi:hypothetical protein
VQLWADGGAAQHLQSPLRLQAKHSGGAGLGGGGTVGLAPATARLPPWQRRKYCLKHKVTCTCALSLAPTRAQSAMPAANNEHPPHLPALQQVAQQALPVAAAARIVLQLVQPPIPRQQPHSGARIQYIGVPLDEGSQAGGGLCRGMGEHTRGRGGGGGFRQGVGWTRSEWECG